MKFIHLADLHIGKKLAGYSLLEDQKYIFDQIIGHSKEFGPDAILIAGDVYDRSVPGEEAVKLFEELVSKLSETAPVYIISGNHDSGTRLALFSDFLEKNDVYIVGEFDGSVVKKELKGKDETAHIYMLPFLTPNETRSVLDREDITSYEKAVEAVLSPLELSDEALNILLTHQFYLNRHEDYDKIPTGSEKLAVGGLDDIHTDLIKHFDYAALGHIHGMKNVGHEHVRYSGTPLKYSVNEGEKYLNCVTVTKEDLKVDKIPLRPLRDVITIEGEFSEIEKNEEDREDYVSIILKDSREIPNVKASLLKKFPNLLEIRFKNIENLTIQTKVDEDVLKMSPTELLESFYLQSGDKLTENEREIADTIFTYLLEENR